MEFHEHRGPGRKKKPLRLTPGQLALAHAEALKWRERLRSEKVAPTPGLNGQIPQRLKGPRDEAKERAQFAANVARAEFGRFYWSEELVGKKRSPKSYRQRNDKKQTPS